MDNTVPPLDELDLSARLMRGLDRIDKIMQELRTLSIHFENIQGDLTAGAMARQGIIFPKDDFGQPGE